MTLKSFLLESSRLGEVTIGEPFKAPASFSAAIMLSNNSIMETTLTGTVEERTVTIRVYANALEEPREETELRLDETMAELLTLFFGDFDLGGDIRSIDPTRITVKYGYQTIDSTIFRLADMSLPMIVDDSAIFGA